MYVPKRPPQEQLGPQALNTTTWRLAVPSLYSEFPNHQMAVNGVRSYTSAQCPENYMTDW